MSRLLTPKDIQFIFSIGKNQAYALMHSDGFPAIQINNRIYVSEDALEEWIRAYTGRQYLV